MNRYRLLFLACLARHVLAADAPATAAPPAATPPATASATPKSAAPANGSSAVSGNTPAQPPQAATANRPAPNPTAALAANIHALRVAIEQQEANELALQRMTPPVISATTASDPTSTDTLRSQLASSMATLDDRCLGVNARTNGGSLVLICGDNSGQVTTTQTRNNTVIPVFVQPSPSSTGTP
jgi:hypothetical protein